jgi:hypothetical protein
MRDKIYHRQKRSTYLPYFSTKSPLTSTHFWYHGTSFLIPMSKKSAASDLNHVVTRLSSVYRHLQSFGMQAISLDA